MVYANVIKLLRLFGRVLVIYLFMTNELFALYRPGDIIWGIQGGYSQLIGSYANELSDSPFLGIYGIPYVHRYLLGEIDLSYSGYALSKSQSSFLYKISLQAGPLFYYPVVRNINIFGGLTVGPTYFHVYGKEADQTSSALKPSFSIKGGIMINIKRGFGVRLGVDYFHSWISNEQFANCNYYAAVSYNYHANQRYQSENDDTASIMAKINKYYSLGEQSFARGELLKARENFNKVLEYNESHYGALEKIKRIDAIEKNFEEAMELMSQKKYQKAIPLLEKTAPYKADAKIKLDTVRKKLLPQISAMEKKGIAYYDQRKYKQCIRIMKEILVIDPLNKIAKIYLPRAKKRYRALQNL